jgi:hypothetical protein
MMTDAEFIDGYHSALCAYHRAKTGHGDRVEAFAELLAAERALMRHVGAGAYLARYRERYPEQTDS